MVRLLQSLRPQRGRAVTLLGHLKKDSCWVRIPTWEEKEARRTVVIVEGDDSDEETKIPQRKLDLVHEQLKARCKDPALNVFSSPKQFYSRVLTGRKKKVNVTYQKRQTGYTPEAPEASSTSHEARLARAAKHRSRRWTPSVLHANPYSALPSMSSVFSPRYIDEDELKDEFVDFVSESAVVPLPFPTVLP